VTFKADTALVQAMEGISNRSEFIRAAILAALDGVCPLCHGTGVMNPRQRKHWEEFKQTHEVERCDECDVIHLVCRADPENEETP
ncbi:MAG: ribbon-helix-helix domain-containing protein, partial [Thermoanaerobaculales bacterium]|nr:ribbon-helix-helix domain-containing protein [Thermoanaerobaculales bacterium]